GVSSFPADTSRKASATPATAATRMAAPPIQTSRSSESPPAKNSAANTSAAAAPPTRGTSSRAQARAPARAPRTGVAAPAPAGCIRATLALASNAAATSLTNRLPADHPDHTTVRKTGQDAERRLCVACNDPGGNDQRDTRETTREQHRSSR